MFAFKAALERLCLKRHWNIYSQKPSFVDLVSLETDLRLSESDTTETLFLHGHQDLILLTSTGAHSLNITGI